MIRDYELVIEPKKGFVPVDLREIWAYRELLYFLAWRDIKVRYKQAALGVAWVFLQPVAAMLLFTLLFGRFVRMPTDGVPYPIFVYAGLILWSYFSTAFSQAANSLVTNSNLVTKVYFPRILVPISPAVSAFPDLVISSVLLAALMIYYGIGINTAILLTPLITLIIVINAAGFGIWFSALNVRYRDFQHLLGYLLQVWMFATPVIYPASLLGAEYKWLIMLNPLAAAVESFRAALFRHMSIPWLYLGISAVVGVLVLASGVVYFRRVEKYFADLI